MIKNSIHIICIILLCVQCNLAQGQENEADFEHYSVNDGLPTQTAYNILQSRNGFLWITTDAGVSCFDGKKFVNYTTEDGLGDNEVIDIFEDKKGRIWFTPFSDKLSYFYNDKFYTYENSKLLNDLSRYKLIFNFIQDSSGNLYCQARNTNSIIKIDPQDKVKIYNFESVLGDTNNITSIYTNATNSRVYCFTSKKQVFQLQDETLRKVKTSGGLFATSGSVDCSPNSKSPSKTLFVHNGGLSVINDSVSKLIISYDQIPFFKYRFLATMDKYQNIWLSNFKYNTLFFRYVNGKYAPPVRVLKNIFSITTFDNEDNIWLCTGNQGIYKISYSKMLDDKANYFSRVLLQKNVLCVYNDVEGTLWVGYGNGCITQISPGFIKHHNINLGSRTYNRVMQIVRDKEGDIWCATDETCILLKKVAPFTYAIKQKLVDKSVKDYLKASVKWIAFDKNDVPHIILPVRLAKIKKATMVAEYGNPPGGHDIDESRLYSNYFDSKNGWYISTANGLNYSIGDTTINLADKEATLKSRIQHFAENARGIIFLATYSNGVIALENNKVVARLTRAEGLQGVICRRIYLRNDTLYIATNGGITVAVFKHNRFSVVQNIGGLNGLPSLDVNDISFAANTLYAATSEGLVVLSLPLPGSLIVGSPPLTILSFKVNETTYDMDEPIVFPYSRQRIRIEFIAPVMDKPGEILYRYRFVGKNTDWQVTNSNLLEFNELQYNDYRIEIQAKKYNSDWSPSKELYFTITPPFYFTWWFRVSVVLGAAFAIYFFARYHLTKRFRLQLAELKQNEAIEKERNRIAADIHDDIGTDLTNIVILSRLLNRSVHPAHRRIVNKLEKSSNEVINKMNDVIWTLNKANDTLHNLIAYLRKYFKGFAEEHKLEGTINIDNDMYTDHLVKAELSRNIILIVKETLNNTVKHAGATKIEINLSLKSGNILFLKIIDNGDGFNPDTESITGGGNGLKNISKRALAIKGTAKIYSRPGAGCIITISVPI